jgi:hypothetical protein
VKSAHFRAAASVATLAGLALGAPTRASFVAIELEVCGNDLVEKERGEDCDSHAAEPGARCAAPGEAHACRYTCDATTPCPKRWGCGEDGVCRLGSGDFAALGEPVIFPALQQLQVGDFDGDHRPDLLLIDDDDAFGRRAAGVLYPALAGAPRAFVSIPGRVGAPLVGELDGNATADVAFADVGGVSVFLGAPDRGARLASFPFLIEPVGTFLRGIPLDVIPGDPGDEVVAFVDTTKIPGDKKVWLVRPAGALAEAKLVEVPGGEDDLAGGIAWGRFDEGAKCPQIVLPYTGHTSVPLFTPCRTVGTDVRWNDENGALAFVTLPGNATIDGGVRLADLDLDGHLDLLIAASGKLYAAWGQGDGTFLSATVNGVVGQAGPYALPAVAGVPSPLPLAIADLNGDGVLDFVVPQGVVLSQAVGFTLVYANAGVPWTEAVIADFNDNGLLDVAAVSYPRLGIDFLNNAGKGTFNPGVVSTDGGPSHLVSGDFDGDLVNDLAFSVARDESTARVLVAFGAAHGPPEAPLAMADLGDVEQITAARLADATGLDGIDDLLIASQGESMTDSLVALRGHSARLMTAPLALRSDANAALPLALAIGRFDDKSAAIAALGVDEATGRLRLWLVDGASEITLSQVAPSAALSSMFQSSDGNPHPTFTYGAVAAAGDLDGNGVDEAVIVAPWGSASGAALVIADYQPSTFMFTPRPEQPVSTSLSIDSALQIVDVDGDGRADAILLGGSDEAPAGVLVFWNDGHGGLATDAPSKLDVEGGATGFKCVPSTAGGCDLFVISTTATFSCALRADHQIEATPIAGVPGGDDLAAADFDGDGTLDLAIASAAVCQIFHGKPVNP